MATKVVLPQVGETVVEGTIDRWLKQVGERVEKYEPLVEIVTDKVNVELPSPVSGRLLEILVPEGTTVPVGAELAIIEEEAAAVGAPAPAPAPAAAPAAAKPSPQPAGAFPPRATPRVRRLARERGVDLAQVKGTGPGGRILERDVLAFAEAEAAPVPAAPAAAEEEALPVSAVRRTIAQRMAHSYSTIPHAWLMMEADVTPLVRLRESLRDEFRRQHDAELTYLAFAIKAAAEALRQHLQVNSTWAEERIVVKRRINMGVAIATDYGLMVPVIRDADRKSIAGLALELHELTERARSGKLTLEDVQGGTFTINNTGTFGSIVSKPIINAPQAAILTTEAITKRPVVTSDDAIAARSIMNLCLSFDHRILDGAEAAAFLRAVKERLEAMGPGTAVN